MWLKATVVSAYLAGLVIVGLLARKRAKSTAEDYFVASRSLPTLVLFLTMAATNFSAFTVFGFSGEGWRSGYSFYAIMAFGTGLMALSFEYIGKPVWEVGKEKGLYTPADLVFYRFQSPALRLVFMIVMTIFTMPYLAMQPMAAGYALEELLGIPYLGGAALITAVMLAYTFFGGMRGVAWTDVLQGGMLIVLLAVCVGIIAAQFGGLSAANAAAASRWPELFSRPGLGSAFSPGIWFGYVLLWLLCDPMFPQLFQRFYAAKSVRALRKTMVLYPLITGSLFLLPVTIGVIGRLGFPELPVGAESDKILPLMLSAYAPAGLEALVLTAALAALMSTLDSQLLSLSSMFTRDIVEPLTKGRAAPAWLGKLSVTVLALVGLLIAWRPPATFLEIATETFTGLAVLFPTVVATLYWKDLTTTGAIVSILAGEGLVICYHFGFVPDLGTLPVVPIVFATSVVLVLVSLLTGKRPTGKGIGALSRDKFRPTKWLLVIVLLFVLSNDYWAWGDGRLGPLNFPWWVWYFFGLCILTSLAFWRLGCNRQ
jgi:SSS family solute:Na+ symporter